MKTMDYTEVPMAVQEVISEEEEETEVRKITCAHCDTVLYDIVYKDGDYAFVDKDGRMPGGSFHRGGIPIEDPGAVPRQLDSSKSTYLCGRCIDVEEFEQQGTALHGLTPQGHHYAAFVLGSIIDNHYLGDGSSEWGIFTSAFEGYALEEDTIQLEDGTVMVPKNPDEVGFSQKEIRDGEVDVEYSVFASPNTVFIPKQEA